MWIEKEALERTVLQCSWVAMSYAKLSSPNGGGTNSIESVISCLQTRIRINAMKHIAIWLLDMTW